MIKILPDNDGNMDSRSLLLNALERVDEFENVMIIARGKDESVSVFTSSIYPWFLFACSSILQDMAMHYLKRD